ncbi:hypothetical protein PIIN_00546 [Serendipita indica DSM 11827]|uniref:Uncharacterized protein n=1 Tax=Serendipita indica (strain DSM 11827) TaxID=1109443 RepID=G4U2R3_SERID|nr:hypothetical protein PIIN_00546 [Serendipita indica DSM 11827]
MEKLDWMPRRTNHGRRSGGRKPPLHSFGKRIPCLSLFLMASTYTFLLQEIATSRVIIRVLYLHNANNYDLPSLVEPCQSSDG